NFGVEQRLARDRSVLQRQYALLPGLFAIHAFIARALILQAVYLHSATGATGLPIASSPDTASRIKSTDNEI
ncbi:hypothetical protein, partial [Mesorhizobium sp. M7A.F.Ca.US.006.01.2.1]|uniref:hypothetical protein n=1 Tax=Mesorhizobium sp. M7A.F.Ca.US.006.01.2.1 TaxID=2496708 RepID=UPI0019D03575